MLRHPNSPYGGSILRPPPTHVCKSRRNKDEKRTFGLLLLAYVVCSQSSSELRPSLQSQKKRSPLEYHFFSSTDTTRRVLGFAHALPKQNKLRAMSTGAGRCIRAAPNGNNCRPMRCPMRCCAAEYKTNTRTRRLILCTE